MSDRTNAQWLADLDGPDLDAAIADLRATLLRGLRHALAGRGVTEADLEDFTQDALLKALAERAAFRGEARFTTWAQKIAVRVALTELRRRRWRDVSLQDRFWPRWPRLRRASRMGARLERGPGMMTEPEITVFGAYWCPDCRRSKQFLGEHQIPYRWVDIEKDPEGEAYVLEKNAGKRIIPTIEFAGGGILVEPSNAALAAKLGLKLTAERSHYDLIVVGGGPAGLTAALYAAREGVDTLVIERAALGGQAAATERLDNMPGFAEGVEGATFADQLRRQAARFGVEMLQAQDVVRLRSHDNYHCVFTGDESEYSARALLLASGSRYRRLEVPGENDFIGAGIHFCATCDGPFYKGESVAVVGGGNSAAEESIFLAGLAEKVTLLVRGDHLKASAVIQEKVVRHPKIDVRFNTEVVAFDGARGRLAGLTVRDRVTRQEERLRPSGVFVFVGLTPNTGFLDPEWMRLDRWGFVVTGHDLVHDGDRPRGFEAREPGFLESSVPGIFAAGDVRSGSTKQVASATGEGASAALMIREHLKAT